VDRDAKGRIKMTPGVRPGGKGWWRARSTAAGRAPSSSSRATAR
jgi:hypothetical protein